MDGNSIESLEAGRNQNATEVANQVLGQRQFDVEKAVRAYFKNEGIVKAFSELTGGLLEF